jgi:hypothetical protein
VPDDDGDSPVAVAGASAAEPLPRDLLEIGTGSEAAAAALMRAPFLSDDERDDERDDGPDDDDPSPPFGRLTRDFFFRSPLAPPVVVLRGGGACERRGETIRIDAIGNGSNTLNNTHLVTKLKILTKHACCIFQRADNEKKKKKKKVTKKIVRKQANFESKILPLCVAIGPMVDSLKKPIKSPATRVCEMKREKKKKKKKKKSFWGQRLTERTQRRDDGNIERIVSGKVKFDANHLEQRFKRRRLAHQKLDCAAVVRRIVARRRRRAGR